MLTGLGYTGKVLLVDSSGNKNLLLSSRNLPKVKLVPGTGVNIFDVVNSNTAAFFEGFDPPGAGGLKPMNRREYVLKLPVITEKSTHVKENLRTVAFKVLRDANKIEIKDAVEKIFKVKVQACGRPISTGRSGARAGTAAAGRIGRRPMSR